MNVTLHQLRIFVTVAESPSVSRAAELLLLSQPAVSMQIKTLERILGLRLFDHTGRRMQLTEAGRDLYGRATRVIGLMDETAQAMADLREGRQGRLRVVATTTVGIYVVPRLLGLYHERHPGVEVSLEVANWERTCERLFAGEADVAVAGPHPEPRLQMQPFMEDELVVIASPRSRLAHGGRLSLQTLAAESMVVREPGSGTRAAVEKIFAEHGLTYHRTMELSRNGAIKQVVMAGLGIAVISRGALALELESGMLCTLDVEGFPIVRPWNVITRAGFALSPAAATFCDELRRSEARVR
jgi:DNA-binding transcriptional LysR family regulator